MIQAFKADLHIHTCLSPCAGLDMSPSKILAAAQKKGIGILGICDHNSAENAQAMRLAARDAGIHVLLGMEICSSEEVHVLALFDDLPEIQALQEKIYQNLPGENDEEAFGPQVIFNAQEDVLGFCDKLLIGATTLSFEEITRQIQTLDGLAVASHVDREAYGLIGQLGFVPENAQLDALEVSPLITMKETDTLSNLSLPLITSSDAHFPEDIGKCHTTFFLEEGSVAEIKKALSHEGGRSFVFEINNTM